MWLAKLHQDGRAGERHQVDADATLRTSEDDPVDILITDVSATGCLFVSQQPLEVGAAISVGFAGLGKLDARIVRAGRGGHGAEFAMPLNERALLVALARPKDTVVPLVMRTALAATVEDMAAADPRWPVPARFLVILALVLASWGTILALLSLV